MRRSTERILTTHVGSLPRSQEVTDVLFGRETGQPKAQGDQVIASYSQRMASATASR